jgi:tripartite-type tricarboxylate transporter receptor subunit TctC
MKRLHMRRTARRLHVPALACSLALVAACGARPAAAQPYPSQLVRIVVPFTPGSQTDILGRAYADKLQEIWKRDVIVENKPGLAGTATTAKAPADGYTLLLVVVGSRSVTRRYFPGAGSSR